MLRFSKIHPEAKKTADPAAVAITINAIIMIRRPLPPAQPRAARGRCLPQPSALAVVCRGLCCRVLDDMILVLMKKNDFTRRFIFHVQILQQR